MAAARVTWTLVVVALTAAGCKSRSDSQQPVTDGSGVGAGGPAVPVIHDDAEDVLAEVSAINGPDAAQPPTKWKEGHAKPRKFDPKAITARDNGFVIQLPSKAPVPTPTIHEGRIYVGGGFHSKEFYCFDARTGALIWGVDVDDDGPSSAVVADGVVVFNTESCTIFALDASTGEHLWSWWLGDPLASTPAIANGRVYTSYPAVGNPAANLPNQGGQLQLQQLEQNDQAEQAVQAPAKRAPASHVLACFELRTGKVIWQKWIDSEVMSAPVVTDDELYVATFGGTLYTFDPADGTIRSAKRSRITSAPILAGKDLFYTRRTEAEGDAVREAIVLGDSRTKTERRRFSEREAEWLDPDVQAKSKYAQQSALFDSANGFSSTPPALNAQAAQGNVGQANVSSMQAFQGSRVAHLGGFTYSTMGDKFTCVDPDTGKAVWSMQLDGDLRKQGGHLGSAPAAIGDEVIIATLGGQVLRMDATSGKVLHTYEIGAPARFQPAVMDGRIYVGTQDGKVVCIDTGDRGLTGWSTWGANMQHTGVAK